ncbi:MAG: hypothetical protein AB7I68_05220 [Porticoccaceae bacterium]
MTKIRKPRLAGDLYALVDPDERDHALCVLRKGMPADAMASTVSRLMVVPLLEWIDLEHRRMNGRDHTGTDAGKALLSVAEEIVYRCRYALEVYPELLDVLGERWTEWLAVMAQGSAALLWRDQIAADQGRVTGGKGKKGKITPITATINAMLVAMDDKRADALLAEMELDARGKGCVLPMLRGKGIPCVKFVDVTAESVEYEGANGRLKTLKVKTLRNKVSGP